MVIIRKLIITAITFFLWQGLHANPVNVKEVNEVALRFLGPDTSTYQIHEIIPLTEGNQILIYAVTLKPEGWMLLSADDVIQPLLAFSFDSEYLPDDRWNENTRNWIQGYKIQIAKQITNKSAARHHLWDQYNYKDAIKSQKAVSALINAEFDQGSGWNRYCPVDEDGPGGRTYVGCVAVAMAQILSYYNYPEKPEGFHNYAHSTYGSIYINYNDEAPYNWSGMSDSNSDTLNARLLYQCAVSVNMDFGPDGSGAITSQVKGALTEHFGYPAGVIDYVTRYDDTEEWKAFLRSFLDNGIPVIYDGNANDGKAGHAFNIDGYTGDFFHLNWGWSGSFNGNFTIDNLAPGTHDFTKNQNALVNIRPPVPGPINMELTNKSIRENMPEGTMIGTILVTDEDPDNTYTFTLDGPSIFDKASNYFYLSGDTVKSKMVFNYSQQNALPLRIYVEDQYGNKLDKQFSILIIEEPKLVTEINVSGDFIWYPNPSSGTFYMKNLAGKEIANALLEIYTINGSLVYSKSLSALPDTEIRIDIPHLGKGLFLALIKTTDKVIPQMLDIR